MSLKLNISSQLASFKQHLQIPNNTRILFSGPFGSGKTYFIERFFEENEGEYIKIKIHPVHYSVASNEDIFELIKYDILFELLGRQEIEAIEEKSTLSLVLTAFVQSKMDEIEKFGMSAISLTDPTLGKIGLGLLSVSKLVDKFDKYKSSTKKSTQNLIIEYLKNVNKKPGIREEDLITILLCEVVRLVKEKSGKKIVLVIDDLDRIDPEHIFRILNVFGAHFDILKEDNKFDFDHVILVCDENNIRNIFKAKYGVDVDYNGYIDKFFSKEIFFFDITNSLLEKIETFIQRASSVDKEFHKDMYVYEVTIYIIKALIKNSFLQTRTLMKLTDKDLSKIDGRVKYLKNENLCFLIAESFQILASIYGTFGSLEDALRGLANLEKGDNFHFEDRDPKSIDKLRDILPLLQHNKHRFSDSEFGKTHILEYRDTRISFTLCEFPHQQRGLISVVQARDIEITPLNSDVKFFNLLYEAYNILKNDFHIFRK